MFDYAFFNQSILGNESAICYDAENGANDPLVIEKFRKHFALYAYEDFSQFDGLVRASASDRVYFVKSGRRDGKVAAHAPSLIHAVFPTPPEEHHGSVFAFISQWLSDSLTRGQTPYIPYMINLPDISGDLRKVLNIPEDAFVIGSYGGWDSFDIPFVYPCIQHALGARSDIWFLFMNYPRVLTHERVIYLDRRADLEFKVRFINTADAMLHARKLGESFGLACGEFSVRNKPVITWSESPERSHIDILGKKAILYFNVPELVDILINIDRRYVAQQEWDCYSNRFGPVPVMEKFKQVFLTATVEDVGRVLEPATTKSTSSPMARSPRTFQSRLKRRLTAFLGLRH